MIHLFCLRFSTWPLDVAIGQTGSLTLTRTPCFDSADSEWRARIRFYRYLCADIGTVSVKADPEVV